MKKASFAVVYASIGAVGLYLWEFLRAAFQWRFGLYQSFFGQGYLLLVVAIAVGLFFGFFIRLITSENRESIRQCYRQFLVALFAWIPLSLVAMIPVQHLFLFVVIQVSVAFLLPFACHAVIHLIDRGI